MKAENYNQLPFISPPPSPSLCSELNSSMSDEILHDFSPYFQIHKDGHVQRLRGTHIVPPTEHDPHTGVRSKDAVVSPETAVSARLYLPKTTTTDPAHKLPLLVYFHGGAFCVQSAFAPIFQPHLISLAAEANAVVVSVDYRLAPEHCLPVAYDDSWAALQWVASHSNGDGSEVWLNDHVDFDRVFLAGDSAGANIAHDMAVQVGANGLDGVKTVGLVLVHPFFGTEPDKLWSFLYPTSRGCNDPRLNPAMDRRLSSLGCCRVLVCVAEKDKLRERGCTYYEVLRESGWGGKVEMMETQGEDHIFHLKNPSCDKAVALLKHIALFIN